MSNPSSTSAGPSNPTQSASVSTTMGQIKQASSRLYDIPSLDNDGMNFQTWKHRIEMILDIRGLWGIVSGNKVKPDQNTHPDESAEWLIKDKEARAQIILTLKDEPLSGVLYTTTSTEAWRKLSKRYERKGKQTIAYLIGKLFRNTLSDDASMETQLYSMRQKAHVLQMLGQPLEDSLIAVAMILSLPASYSILCTILMSSGDRLTVESVIAQVLVEEKAQKGPSQMALAAKTTQPKGKSKMKDGKKKKQKKCNYAPCKKSGHTKDECWKKKADEATKGTESGNKERPKEKERAELAAQFTQVDLNDSPLHLFVAKRSKASLSTCKWIIDLGASAHMSCQWNWFKTYHPLSPPQRVVIGNGNNILAIGIGCIGLNLDVGNGQMKYTVLTDVYHIPELDENLLSVSYLASRNFYATFGPDSCTILADNETVAIRYKRDALYILAATLSLKDQTAYIVHGPSPFLDPSTPLAALATQTTSSRASLDC